MSRLTDRPRARLFLIVFGAGLILACLVELADAQDRVSERRAEQLDRPISLGELQPTPEMWIYQQEMRRYDDPRNAVRRNAELRAAQRQQRIAASEWFGYSKARPIASATPFTDSYSPRWGGNSSDPNLWRGVGGPLVFQHRDRSYSRW